MRVLVIEDSLVVRKYVCALLDAEPDIESLAAADGTTGLSLANSEEPDVILTDLLLPGLGGIEIIRAVMGERPRPIIVLSGHLHDSDKDMAFEAIDAGAVDVMAKPEGLDGMRHEQFRRALLKTIRLMAEVPVVARRPRDPAPATSAIPLELPSQPVDLVAIGASTGGPPLLQHMLASFPAPLEVPIVIVQHIVPGFEGSFARWLASTGHEVDVARHGEQARAGRIYLAPASANLSMGRQGMLLLTPHAPGWGATTSVDVLFASVAEHYGPRAWGILLTGMGTDGAAGLLEMKQRGAHTIVQDRASSTIDGMPAAARQLGAAKVVMTPRDIWATLWRRFGAEEAQASS